MFKILKSLIKPTVKVNYMLNDPTNSILLTDVPLKPPVKLSVVVAGFKGVKAPQGTLEAQANNVYITVAATINHFQKVTNILNWSSTKSLKIYPRAGNVLNAVYDRQSLKYFYATNPKTKKMIYTCDSTDVVAHELGHALLDAMRPDFWNVQALEIDSFHEGFSDCTAMMAMLQFPQAIEKIVKENNGDLRKSNSLTRIAEQIGMFIYEIEGSTLPYALRDAVNNFKYVDPLKLPANGPDDTLFAESHSFGRLWVAIWYDILVGIYERLRIKDISREAALEEAGNVAYKYMVLAAKSSPRVSKYFNAVCQMMKKIDAELGEPYKDVLNTVFRNRCIYIPEVSMLSVSCDDIKGGDYINFKHGILVPQNKFIKIGKVTNGVKALAVDGIDLSNVEIEVAADKFYTTDKKKNLLGEISTPDDEQVEAALAAVKSIKEIGSNAMWDIANNKLVRNWII